MGAPVIVEYASITPTPWRNGRGVTRNLFDDSGPDGEWTWRVSIAEISGTQPYSPYPGVRRGQVALGPGDVALRVNGEPVRLAVEEVITFDGEDDVEATPDEPGFLDLNVMSRRDTWSGDVRIVVEPGELAAYGAIVVLVALSDGSTVDGRPLHRLDGVMLADGDAAWFDGRFAVARLTAV